MAKEAGFMHCGGCNDMATVLEFGGQKVGTFYTSCKCGITQGGGLARQELIKKSMVNTVEEYQENQRQNQDEVLVESEGQQITVVPMGGAGLVVDDAEEKTEEETIQKPSKKGFIAMWCGLATCAGLMVGYQLGVSRG